MNTKVSELLKGIVEMDETYVGGKPRKSSLLNPRGRAARKTPIVGMAERSGEVRTRVIDKNESMNFKTLKRIFDENVDKIKSVLIIDEYKGYSPIAGNGVAHAVINHTETYVDGDIHTNTIEGFWSLIKRAWHGSRHHYSRKNTHRYVAETNYVHNNRKNENCFLDTIKQMAGTEKEV